MSISRTDQIIIAKELLGIIDNHSDPKTISYCYKIASTVLKYARYEDNGVAFDLCEYAFESLQIANGKEGTGWQAEARLSLERQFQELSHSA